MTTCKKWRWAFLFIPAIMTAQEPEQPQTEQGLTANFSFVGALKYPGLQLGADYLYKDNFIEKEKHDGRIKAFHTKRYFTANLGFYHHEYYNTNIFLLAGHQWRRERASGWYTLLEPQIGVSRTFLDGTTYKVSDDGHVRIKKWAGHFYAASAFTFGIGKKFTLGRNKPPLSVFLKTSLYANMPYNNFVYARLMANIGVSYEFDGLLRHTVKQNHIIKNKD